VIAIGDNTPSGHRGIVATLTADELQYPSPEIYLGGLLPDADPHRKAMRAIIAIFVELEKSALVLNREVARALGRTNGIRLASLRAMPQQSNTQ
jgi:hypothetical protein